MRAQKVKKNGRVLKKQKLLGRGGFQGPPTIRQLVEAIKKEFEAIPQSPVDSWMSTCWSRLKRCVQMKGDWVGKRECSVPRILRS